MLRRQAACSLAVFARVSSASNLGGITTIPHGRLKMLRATVTMRIGVPKEIYPDEKRVATVPEVVEKLIKLGFSVAIESGAGDAANFSDDAYRNTGGAEWKDRRLDGKGQRRTLPRRLKAA